MAQRHQRPLVTLIRRLIIPLFALMAVACNTVDDDRIPYAPVRISFSTQAMWETFGVTGAVQSRSFVRDQGLPAGFPYTDLTYTGFGGVLLCGDIHGNAVAYDLACPVERSRTTLIIVDQDAVNAFCPKCGSIYDIYANFGIPLAGEAAQRGYALKRYSVSQGTQTDYRLISN